MPPVPAAVMMCESANDVTEMSERVPVGVPRSVEPSASHESSIDLQPVRVGDRADAVPVGHVADQVRDEDRARARADHRLDRVDVDVVGVGLDVDEHRHEPGAHDRRDVGGERDRRRDDLVAGLQPEQLDREIQRRRARVAHHAPALAEQLGDALLERAHVLADAQRLRTAAQHRDDRVDLALVVHAARVVDPARHHASDAQPAHTRPRQTRPPSSLARRGPIPHSSKQFFFSVHTPAMAHVSVNLTAQPYYLLSHSSSSTRHHPGPRFRVKPYRLSQSSWK